MTALGEVASLLRLDFTADDGRIMPYLLQLPPRYDIRRKYPLVLCFHGAGGRGSDNLGRGSEAGKILRSPAVQAVYPSLILQPQCPEEKKWVETDWRLGNYHLTDVLLSLELSDALQILRLILSHYAVDHTRILVTGQSMGGFATWDIIQREPELFAAAVPVCGGGDPAAVASLKSLPIWAFHGDIDPTIPVTSTREMVSALTAVGGQIRYTEFSGVTHGSWKNAWGTPNLLTWFFAQKRAEIGRFSISS